MVFHLRQNNRIPLLEVGTSPSVGDKVDRFGGTAGDDDALRVVTLLQFGSAGLVALGGLTGQRVDGSVDIGVGVA